MPRTNQQRLVEGRLWELIEPLLPPRPAPKGPGGCLRVDERAALQGILFVLHTGCRWGDLPLQLRYGSGHTAWRRLRAWQAAGVWDGLHRLVQRAPVKLWMLTFSIRPAWRTASTVS